MPAPIPYSQLPAHVRAKLGPNSPLLDKRRAPARDLEHRDQVALIQWADDPETRTKYPSLKWLFAIPNGGQRSKAVAGKLKAAGVKRGVPDLQLPVPRAQYHGCFLELKVEGSVMTLEQKQWQHELDQLGYCALLALGLEEAKRALTWYLDLPSFGFATPTPTHDPRP